MKEFYISVYSGLNNKLLPLLSLLRIAEKENTIINCFWSNHCWGNKIVNNDYHFLDLFEPIKNIQFISRDKFEVYYKSNNKIYNKNGSDRNRKEIIYYSNKNNNITVFYNIVHCISYLEDNIINYCVPYPSKKINKNNYTNELKLLIKKLIPKKIIEEKIISNCKNIDFNKTLGIHIRLTDGGFKDLKYIDAFNYITKFLEKNTEHKIYVATDDLSIESKLKDIFNKKIITMSDYFGNYEDKVKNNEYGLKNSIIEMYILSKCNTFIGTKGSSFSFMVWLLSNNDYLEFW